MISSAARRLYWSSFTLRHVLREKSLPFRPLDRILELQRQRLRAIVRHAFERVPFYRQAMSERGLTPADIRSADDLAKLPLIDGPLYARQPERFRPGGSAGRRVLTLHSSGTTGSAKAVDCDARALFLSLAQGQRRRRVVAHFTGRALGYREAHLVPPGSVAHQIRQFLETHSWTPRGIDLRRMLLTPGELPLEEEIERINRFRPDVLRGYGSYLGALLRKAHRRGLKLAPKAVVYGADSMPESDRALIEVEFGIPVLSTYQAVEALHIGFQCELRRGFHLDLDAIAVRVVDDQGRDVAPGERGQVVLSNLTNFASVLLNYRLGDAVTLGAEACPCGRSLPVISLIEGRSDDLIHGAGGRTAPAPRVSRELRAASGLDLVQVVQLARDRFVVRAVAAQATDRAWAAASLAAAIEALTGCPCRTAVEWVESLVPEPNGKTRVVISRWQPPELAEGE